MSAFGVLTLAMTLVPAWHVATPPQLPDSALGGAGNVAAFVDMVSRTPARSMTEASIAYTDTALYVVFWCRQNVAITASQTTNNVGFGSDDYVGIGIDPTGNGNRSYYFEVTPRGTQYAQASESTRYTPQWIARAKVAPGGWTALLEIPFSALTLPSHSEQTWRINLVRGVSGDSEKLSTSFNSQMDAGPGFPNLADDNYWMLSMPVRLAVHQRARPAASIDVYSLSVAGAARSSYIAADGTSFVRNPRTIGVDATLPLTETLSLVAAAAPDFSNVDADQITIVPQIFQRDLSEYRPFFARGSGYIDNDATALAVNSPADLTFYSPAIGPIDRGLKLEGTYGAYQSLGILEAAGTNETSGAHFDDVAFGWKHVLPGRAFGYWTNGAVVNHGSLHDSTVEFGTQARDSRTGWVGALFHSDEETSTPQTRYHSWSSSGFIDHQSPTHEYLWGYKAVSPGFAPVDGFTEVADISGPVTEMIQYFGGKGPISKGTIDAFADRYVDATGNVHKADAGATVTMEHRSGSVLTLQHVNTEARAYGGNYYSGYPSYASGYTQPFTTSSIDLAIKPSSPSPFDVRTSWGRFGDAFLQQSGANGTRSLTDRLALSYEYDALRSRPYIGAAEGQWLRRIGLQYALGRDASIALGIRGINGAGGFAAPGNNVYATFSQIFANGNQLYAAFGTPSSPSTLDRFLVKYVLRYKGP